MVYVLRGSLRLRQGKSRVLGTFALNRPGDARDPKSRTASPWRRLVSRDEDVRVRRLRHTLGRVPARIMRMRPPTQGRSEAEINTVRNTISTTMPELPRFGFAGISRIYRGK